MRFDRHSSPPRGLTRRDQFRMIGLVVLLGMVIGLIKVSSNPEAWNWFVLLSDPDQSSVSRTSDGVELKPYNIRRPAAAEPLPDDTYYARVEETVEAPAATESQSPGKEVAAPTSSSQSPPASPGEREGEGPAVSESLSQLPEDALQGIEDDWFGLTRAEQPALLAIARRLDSIGWDALLQAADPDVTVPVMLGSPDYYRGRAVAFTGRVKRLVPGSLHHEGESRPVWEAYVVTSDSQNTPVLVFLNEPPAGMPQGQSIDEKATVAGYVLRRYAYPTAGGEAVSLMMFAPTLQWHPPPPPAGEDVSQGLGLGALIFAATVGVGLLGLLLWYALSDRRYRHSRLYEIAESRLDAAPDELQSLESLDAGDPHRLPVEELSALDRQRS